MLESKSYRSVAILHSIMVANIDLVVWFQSNRKRTEVCPMYIAKINKVTLSSYSREWSEKNSKLKCKPFIVSDKLSWNSFLYARWDYLQSSVISSTIKYTTACSSKSHMFWMQRHMNNLTRILEQNIYNRRVYTLRI